MKGISSLFIENRYYCIGNASLVVLIIRKFLVSFIIPDLGKEMIVKFSLLVN